MNIKGIKYKESNSTHGRFVNISKWLLNNLDARCSPRNSTDGLFIVSMLMVSINLKTTRIGIIWTANTTEYEAARVNPYLEFAILHLPAKYLVIDWFYPYSSKIFKSQSCSDMGDIPHEVKRFDIQTPIVKWKNKIVIRAIKLRTSIFTGDVCPLNRYIRALSHEMYHYSVR